MRLYAAMRFTKDIARWGDIAKTFPDYDPLQDPAKIDYAPFVAWRREVEEIVRSEKIGGRAILEWYRDRPINFINHWGTAYNPRKALTGRASSPFLLFQRQRELVEFLTLCLYGSESGLIEKSRDMGATWICCLISIWLWCCWPGASVGWGSRKEELVDEIGDPDSIFEKIRMAIRGLPFFLVPEGLSDQDHLTFMKCVNPHSGSTITGESGDNIGRGGRSLMYFKDESAHYARPERIEAALADNTDVQIDISSVHGLGNVFHRRREAGKVWAVGSTLEHGRTGVFVLDWRDHPGKDEEWYRNRRQKAVDDGILHVFKQEVDRDYAASVEGIIIKPEWVKAAIDAHITLGLDDSGGWSGGLDVADGESGDGNALALFKGIVLRHADAWGEVDAGAATRRTIQNIEAAGILEIDVQYDCVGVGAAVKAEANRLSASVDEYGFPLLPEGIGLIPWSAGARVLNPDEPINPDDRDSSTNRDMFANLKAQAWWMVAQRFEKTYRAIEEGIAYDSSELISIDGSIPMLRQIEKELSQPTVKKRPSDLKLLVDKTPEGSKSPNIGDAIVMAAFPLTGLKPVYATAILEFQVNPFPTPDFWPRAYAMKVEPGVTSVLWGAYDKDQDILYITTEHVRTNAEPAINAQAIVARGKWVPGIIESDETRLEARQEMAAVYWAHELSVVLADRAFGAGVQDVAGRIASGRLKVFATCQRFFREYRAHRRDEDDKIIGAGLMDCVRILARPQTILYMKPKPKFGFDVAGKRLPGFNPSHRGDPRMGY